MSLIANNSKPPFRLLIADDDAEDVQLIKDCLVENHLQASVNDVENGQNLLDTLRKSERTEKEGKPHLILLDINMPRKNGFEALKEIKQDKDLCSIPVVIFSTSKAEKDIRRAYELGANCFITKPNSSTDWHSTIGKLGRFWIECVTNLP